jgi:hypothetical protein
MVRLKRVLTRLFQAKSGLVGNILLLRDFNRRKREIESMEVRMTSLKEAQLQLTKEVKLSSGQTDRLYAQAVDKFLGNVGGAASVN